MEKRINHGYEIIQSIVVGKTEFVLGVNKTETNPYVTWECVDKNAYYYGNYANTLLAATRDLCERAIDEIEKIEQREKRAAHRNPDNSEREER